MTVKGKRFLENFIKRSLFDFVKGENKMPEDFRENFA